VLFGLSGSLVAMPFPPRSLRLFSFALPSYFTFALMPIKITATEIVLQRRTLFWKTPLVFAEDRSAADLFFSPEEGLSPPPPTRNAGLGQKVQNCWDTNNATKDPGPATVECLLQLLRPILEMASDGQSLCGASYDVVSNFRKPRAPGSSELPDVTIPPQVTRGPGGYPSGI